VPIDRIDPWDFNRCYVLPAGVLTNNIPPHRTPGSLGAHEAARGLLVEVCRHTGARPNAVFHTAEEVREPHTWGTTIVQTIIALATLRDGTGLCVASRHRQHRHIDRDDDWTMRLDDVVLHAEARRYPPSPPYQGRLVAWHLGRREQVHVETN
jgi:hypothetical protein